MATWDAKLCSCSAKEGFCILVALLPMCHPIFQGYAVSKSTHESWFTACLCPLLFCCIGAAVNRRKIRNKYLIEGNLCEDCMFHCFCSPCAVCQEYTEVKIKERL